MSFRNVTTILRQLGKANITQACPRSYLCDILLLKGRAVLGHTSPPVLAVGFVDLAIVENNFLQVVVGSTFK